MKKLLIIIIICISAPALAQKTLYIYGGEGRDIFLGCLNCDNHNSKSIWNEHGAYGSRYNAKSIWNEYGNYGSDYSNYSPFNQYANYPPVVVDKDGVFCGYFTVNEGKLKRADFKLLQIIYKNYDMIRDDVGKWYNKIFN